jgi:hypothetical protein
MQTAARVDANLEISIQFSRRGLRDVRQVIYFFQILSTAASRIPFLPECPTVTGLQKGTPGGLWIGIPGTIEQTVGALILAIPFFVSPIMDLFRLYGQTATAFQTIEKPIATALSVSERDARNAATTLRNMDQLIEGLSSGADFFAQKFALATFDLCQSPSSSPRGYRKAFDEILANREKTAKSRSQLRISAQTSILTYRRAIDGLAAALRSKNQQFRAQMETLAVQLKKIADRVVFSADNLELISTKVDFGGDFGGFLRQTRLSKFDLNDLEFEPYPTAGPAFAGMTPAKLPESQVYPIGMAKVVMDHYAYEKNQLSCKVGKSLFLMEPMDQDWVYVLNPDTLLAGFVPSFCLEPVGGGLGVLLREQGPASIGDCVAILEEAAHGAFVVETPFGYKFTVSKGNIGIIFSDHSLE